MEDFFELGFWLVIILIWIISGLLKTKRRQKPQKELPKQRFPPEKSEEIERELLESLGFPFPKEYEIPKPKPKTFPIHIPVVEKKEEGPAKETPLPPPVPEALEEELASSILSSDKLQEGIILSVILGPPKAYRFFRKSIRS